MKYHAFISYSHRDKAWGDWLHKALETYRVPKPLVGRTTSRGDQVPARAFPVFRDREELPTSTNLRGAIQEALEQSRTLIVICSPHSAKSLWVNQEILHYKRLGRENRIFAIVVDGTPNGTDRGAPHNECFPPALRFQLGPDGNLSSERTEPIAADARPHADGKSNALLKLLAGILGIAYDDLRQRDAARRRQRLAAVAAASGLLTVAFAALALAAFVQRNEAQLQRNEAVSQRERAETARKQAESILDFLLVDLRDQLVPLGRQDILGKVQERVDDYYRELQVDPRDIEQLRQRAISLANEGQDAKNKARPAAALAALQAALQIRRELSARVPAHSGWQREMAVTLDEIGDIQRAQGDLSTAMASYEESLLLRRRLIAQDRSNSGRQSDLASSLDRIGEFHRIQKQLPQALDALEESLQLRRLLRQREPGNTLWQANLAETLTIVARARYDEGRKPRAKENLLEALQLLRDLVDRDPRNLPLQSSLAGALESSGLIHFNDRNWPDALTFLDDALKARRAISQHDPLNPVWRESLAALLNRIGETHARMNAPALAAPSLQEAIELYHALTYADPADTSLSLALALTLNTHADVCEELKKGPAAVSARDESIRIFQRLASELPGNPRLKLELAASLTKRALWTGAGTPDNARISVAHLIEALRVYRDLERLKALGSNDQAAMEEIAGAIRNIRTKWNLPAQPNDDEILLKSGALKANER